MPFITFFRPVLFLLCQWACWATPAWAEKADRDQPLHIEADAMRHDEGKLLTIFTGQVVAKKGSMLLRAARLEVQQDKDGQQVAHLWAAPRERVFFRQKREGVDEFTEGEGEMAIYDSQADVLTLMRRAELRILRGTELADQVNGQKIVFNNTTEVMTVDGSPKSNPSAGNSAAELREQRVRAVLTPRKTSTGSGPSAAPAGTSSAKPPAPDTPAASPNRLPPLRVSPSPPAGAAR
jgi:lipopolysaccharide export system protein LptA